MFAYQRLLQKSSVSAVKLHEDQRCLSSSMLPFADVGRRRFALFARKMMRDAAQTRRARLQSCYLASLHFVAPLLEFARGVSYLCSCPVWVVE